MANREKVRYVFTSSNTNRGFHSFIPDLITGLKKVYILKGTIGSGKATFMRLLGRSMLERGFEVEFWISAYDPLNPEGILIPQRKTAIVNGSLPELEIVEDQDNMQIIDLDIYGYQDPISAKRNTIANLHEKITDHREMAFRLLESAEFAVQDIKKNTARHINRQKMEIMTTDLIKRIINQAPEEKHYFASAVTAEGMINYIDSVSCSCHKRYIFIGPSGSGKSAMMARIAENAKQKGLSLEYYHHGFDRNILSVVIIRNHQTALIDACNLSMNPQPGDEIIDIEQLLENYDSKQSDMYTTAPVRQYESLMQEAQQQLENAQCALKELKRINGSTIDFTRLDQLREEIAAEITHI